MTNRIILFLLCMAYFLEAGQWSGIRNGRVHLRAVASSKVTIEWKGVWAADGHDETLYLQAQDGTLVKRIFIPASEVDGKISVSLSAPGDYTLSIPGYSYRVYTIITTTQCNVLFEPVVHHPCVQTSQPQEWYFELNKSASFTIHAKDHRGASRVTLTGPDSIERMLTLQSTKTIPYRNHDSLIVNSAPAGNWRLRIEGSVKIALWLTGVSPWFAREGDSWWVPKRDTARAEVTVGPDIRGITPVLGAMILESQLPAFAYDSLRKVGIRSATYYLQESRLGESLVSTFRQWHESYRKQLSLRVAHGILEAVQPLVGESDSINNRFLRLLARPMAGDTFFIALVDEPNLRLNGPSKFKPLLLSASSAIGSKPLLALPESAGFLNGPMAADAAARRGRDWAESLLAISGKSVGALTWHEWNIRDLVATEYYQRTIDSAWALSNRYPGGATRKLMITQTNIACGADFAPAQQEGFYAALWYASVVAQCAASGKLSALNWFPVIDDPHHGKGLFKWDGITLTPKPVSRAAELLSSSLFPQGLQSSSHSFELDVAASISSSKDSIALLLVNKGDHVQHATIRLSLPVSLQRAALTGSLQRLEESGLTRINLPLLPAKATHALVYDLAPRSITGIILRKSK